MGVFVFTFILIMFQVLRLTEFIVVHGVSFLEVFKLFFYLVLAFLPITVPVSFLFSALIVFNRLSSDNEVIAFKAAGISIYKIMVPVLIFSFITFFISIFVSFIGGPWGNRNFENSLHKIGALKSTINVKEGFFNNLGKDFILYAKKVNTEDSTMKDVFIYDSREMPIAVTAKSSKITIDADTSETILTLYDGYINFIEKLETEYKRAKFKTYAVKLIKGKNVGDRAPNPPSMFYYEINEEINKAKVSGDKRLINSMRVELNRRFAIPFACIVFAIFSTIFGNFNIRSAKASAGVVSFLVMIFYWIVYISGTSLGIKGYLNPYFAVWLGNILFIILTSIMFYKTEY
jgi:lipopolysaccharide export system permease protein